MRARSSAASSRAPGIGGGVQLTSANAIPVVELRAAALTSTQRYQRFDLEAFLPNIGGGRNHADVWFSYLQRETDFFGIGPDTSLDLKTQFAIVQRSYQGSLYRDLADHLQAGVYAQVMSADTSLGSSATVTFPGAVIERADPVVRRFRRVRHARQQRSA